MKGTIAKKSFPKMFKMMSETKVALARNKGSNSQKDTCYMNGQAL